MSVPSLQQICFVQNVILFFQGQFNAESSILANVAKTFNQDPSDEIREVKERAVSELAKQVLSAMPFNSEKQIQDLKSKLHPQGPFAKYWVFEVYKRVPFRFDWNIERLSRANLEAEELETKSPLEKTVERGESKSFSDCAAGMDKLYCFLKIKRADFPGFSSLHPEIKQDLKKRVYPKLSFEIKEALNQPERLLTLFQKMADLNLPNTRSMLVDHAYVKNELYGVRLNLSSKDRIAKLKELAASGNDDSATSLVGLYKSENEEIPLSEEDRRQGIIDLIDLELEGEFYFSATTSCLVNGRIGQLELNLSLEDRIEKLIQKARKGDGGAFHRIWDLYTSDTFGEEHISLELNEQERWAKLQELKTKKTKKFYEVKYAGWIINQIPQLPCHMSEMDQFHYLEDLVFKQNHRKPFLLFELVGCYASNSWKEAPLNIAFQDRLKKLEALTLLGLECPMIALSKYYTPELKNDRLTEIEQVPREEREAWMTKPLEERVVYVFELALRGRQTSFIGNYLMNQLSRVYEMPQTGQIEESLQEIFGHVLRYLQFLNYL